MKNKITERNARGRNYNFNNIKQIDYTEDKLKYISNLFVRHLYVTKKKKNTEYTFFVLYNAGCDVHVAQ